MRSRKNMVALPTAWLLVPLAAIRLAEGFVFPLSWNAQSSYQVTPPQSLPPPKHTNILPRHQRQLVGRGVPSNTGRRQRPSSRRHLLGPDGKEMDVRRHREAYSYVEYWDDFYTGGEAGELEQGETYDWFFGYSRLAVYLNLHIGGAREGRVLVVGCGNSEVSPKMWESGWKNILNVDFCKPVIEAMEDTHKDKLGMEWKVMDARDLAELETGSFDAVIDKGLTDSIMHNDRFSLMMAQLSFEIARVLKPGGVYLLTDYRDPERVQELFKRDEWEGGTLTQEGKLTPAMNLFKGKRSAMEARNPSVSEAEESGDPTQGGEGDGGDEAPEWLSDAIDNGGVKLRLEDSLEGIDVPAKDLGQNKPFKF